MERSDIDSRFAFHPATEVTGPMRADVREAHKRLAHLLNDILPESREKSLCITKLEESMMWANAAIARN